MPPKVEEELPQVRGKSLDFASPNPDQPLAPPAPLGRIVPRQKDKESDDRTPWFARDPKDFPDATGRANAQNPLSRDNAQSGWGRDPLNSRKSEKGDAPSSLSPITDPYGATRDNNRRDDLSGRDGPPFGGRPGNPDKKNARDREGPRDEKEANGEVRSSFFADVFAPRPKEKLTPAQLDRREDFDRLLNPAPLGANANFAPGANAKRVPGSLEPVFEPPRPAGLGTAPALGKLEARPTDSVQAFKQQQARLRGPVLEDPTRKFDAPQSSPAPGFLDPGSKPSLMRQPSVHDIPARKF